MKSTQKTIVSVTGRQPVVAAPTVLGSNNTPQVQVKAIVDPRQRKPFN